MAKRPRLRLLKPRPPAFQVGVVQLAPGVSQAEIANHSAGIFRTLRRLVNEKPAAGANGAIAPADLKAKSPEAGS